MIETTSPSEDYILYPDKRKSLGNLNKRLLFMMLPIILLSFVPSVFFPHGFSISVHSSTAPYRVRQVLVNDPVLSSLFSWVPWFFVAEVVALYFVVARSYRKQTEPIVVLSRDGIAVNTQGTHLNLIRWDEIEEVRCYNLVYRYVGIVPKNTDALLERLGKKGNWAVTLNASFAPLYRPFGVFVAAINIPQVNLSIPADDLLTHIQTYQKAYNRGITTPLGLNLPHTEGVWPPPPRSEQSDKGDGVSNAATE